MLRPAPARPVRSACLVQRDPRALLPPKQRVNSFLTLARAMTRSKGDTMNFMQWLNSLDELLYEVVSWIVFFPVTL